MSELTFSGETFTLDEFGYLDPPGQWSEVFAVGMAEKMGMVEGLGERHWRVIHYLRERFVEDGTVPFFVQACIDNKMRIQEFRDLFPKGYVRGACRLAGINYEFIFSTNEAQTYETSPPGSRFRTNQLGFLLNFEDWEEQFALEVARRHKLAGGVTARRRDILLYLRWYYSKKGHIPPVYEACKANSMDLEELHDLFPMGYRRGACLMAGLPFTP